jgi:hypothetical protein
VISRGIGREERSVWMTEFEKKKYMAGRFSAVVGIVSTMWLLLCVDVVVDIVAVASVVDIVADGECAPLV